MTSFSTEEGTVFRRLTISPFGISFNGSLTSMRKYPKFWGRIRICRSKVPPYSPTLTHKDDSHYQRFRQSEEEVHESLDKSCVKTVLMILFSPLYATVILFVVNFIVSWFPGCLLMMILKRKRDSLSDSSDVKSHVSPWICETDVIVRLTFVVIASFFFLFLSHCSEIMSQTTRDEEIIILPFGSPISARIWSFQGKRKLIKIRDQT